jgi:hypothetical protein
MNHLTDTIDKHIDTITKVNNALFLHVVDILNARYWTFLMSYRCTAPLLCSVSICLYVLSTESVSTAP